MRQGPLADHIDAVRQEKMERLRRDSSAGLKDYMRKLLLKPTGHGFQLVWMEVVEHDDVRACFGRLGSLYVVAGLNLQ